MAYFNTTITTTADPASVFAYLADFANAESWDPSVADAVRLDEGPIAEGARFRVDLSVGRRAVPIYYTLERHEADRLLVFRSDEGFFRSLDTITIEATPTGSRVHYDADLRFEGLGFLIDPLVHIGFQLSGQRSAEGLGHALDALPAREHEAAEPETGSREGASEETPDKGADAA